MKSANRQPYHECPSFENCSAPKCPLDPNINERTIRYPEEAKCKAHKPTRYEIGKKYPNMLPFQGLTKREWDGIHMSEADRAKHRAKLLRSGLGTSKR